ncbi:hypothetical protein F2P81_022377 [Scophthalmus maximus]|uniref:Uncharacterized protein n=1 Tax=Scophthalmus maximus TaxID=52904 RepID=A0A6A4RS63_SCOMX|nr:hypothetical protein F2P81_022377 [Scophthalmus maximus]
MSACTRPLYRPRLDQGFANTKQSFVVSAQHTLDALQNTIGLLQPCKKRKVFPESTIAIMFLAKNTAIVVEYPEPYDTVSVLRNGVDKLLLL